MPSCPALARCLVLLLAAAAVLAMPAPVAAQKQRPVRELARPKGDLLALKQTECDQAAVMNGERPELPAGATEVTPVQDVQNQDDGPLSVLYPDADTTTDALYPLPCEGSIGDSPDRPGQRRTVVLLHGFGK